jgi:hypothetical protein
MPDNFHDADCALRHGGKVCTCGYEKPLTGQEKIITILFQAVASVWADHEHKGYTTKASLDLCEKALQAWLATHPTPEPKYG